ncbi:MAG: nucleotidyltransferase domain-containing protein [Candidatus Micrarchaeota archaeon]
MLERLFRSRAEVAVLNIVLFTDGLHLREISRRAGVSSYEAKRELDSLVYLGVLKSEKRGNQSVFHADGGCSFLEDLRALFMKTEGILSQVKDEIGKIPGVRYCLLYGSAASGRVSEKSDIDLIIIGDADEDTLDQLALTLQKKNKREINIIFWTMLDFKKKLKEKNRFLQNILKKRFILMKGDADEFGGLAEKAFGGKG